MMNYCPLCEGKKHVKLRNKWVECRCLKEQRAIASLRDSGLRGINWKEVKWNVVETSVKKKIKKFEEELNYLLVCGHSARMTAQIALNFLKDSVRQGKTIYSSRISQLVNAQFELLNGGKEVIQKCQEVDSLWLCLDFKRNHSWNDSLMSELIMDRQDKQTLITSSEVANFGIKIPVVYV